MKKISKCPVCEQYFRTALGYEIKVIGDKRLLRRGTKKLICPICHKKVGYSSSESKLNKLTKPSKDNIGFKNNEQGG